MFTDFLEGLRPDAIQKIISDETSIFDESVSITVKNCLPSTKDIPIEKPSYWLQIPDVISCFVDMEGSTKLSAALHPKTTAKAYRYFTQTATLIFHHFGASYIDIKGDGVFALFDSNQVHTALAATVSFKTFVNKEFSPRLKRTTKQDIGGHFGIDQKTVLVRKLGLKSSKGRTDRKNEVWAGKPINMSAKLAGLSEDNTLWVSDRFYNNLSGSKALNSCGCGGADSLWAERDLSMDERFDFNTAWTLNSNWCPTHGLSYCNDLLQYDKI